MNPSSKNNGGSAETVKMIMESVMTFSKDRDVVGGAFSKERNTRDECCPWFEGENVKYQAKFHIGY